MDSPSYIQTPVFKSYNLKEQLDRSVYYKMECFQPTGSFKIRGMDHLCRSYMMKGHTSFIASSGGNAGYSLAYVGKKLGAEVTVIVPQTTTRIMIQKMKGLGAEVEIVGKDWNEAHEYAKSISLKENIPYVSPFDHPLLWEGHSSIIDECIGVIPEPDTIVVAVGGGGLLLGIMEGMKRNKWASKIVTAETKGAASFAKSYLTGKLVELDEINTIATSLGARKVASQALIRAEDFQIVPYVMSDKEALQACETFLDEYNMLVEPACGAALSYAMDPKAKISSDEKVLVIACGGVGMNLDKFLEHQATIK